jgi:hypothetical protein
MKKDHVVYDFVKMPVAHKVETGRSVITQMKTKPDVFKNPDAPLDELEAATDLLEERNLAAINGGKEATVLMHQAEEDWVNIMRVEANYVDRIADGDSAVILSAGFNLVKQPTPAVRPEFSVTLGEKSGTVNLRRQKVEGARSYIWQYCTSENPTNENEWVTAQVTSQASVELTGLTPLTKYWFRVAAVTIAGTTPYCTPIMQVVI